MSVMNSLVKFKFICHFLKPIEIETKMKSKFNRLIPRTQDRQYEIKEQS